MSRARASGGWASAALGLALGLCGSGPAGAQDLDAALADALAQAPALAESAAGEAAAAARVERARAERNPTLAIDGSAGAGAIDNHRFFAIAAEAVTPLAARATAELPLYTGGRIAAALARARGGLDGARQMGEQARRDIVVATVASYGEVLTARRLAERYEQWLVQTRETERQAGLRFRAGEIASTQLSQARARGAEAEAALAQALGRRASAEAAFARLTGHPPGALAPLPGEPATPATLADALALARSDNPALAQARSAEAVAAAGVRAAAAERRPALAAFAEASHVRDQFFPDYRADQVVVGVRGRWQLWSGGRSAADSRAAEAEHAASAARVRAAELAVEGAVIDAWQALATARAVVEAAAARSIAAQDALRGTRLEAEVGAVPTLAILDAEREASEADAAAIEAQAQRILAAWRLAALTGDPLP